jgi:hypothetical protein
MIDKGVHLLSPDEDMPLAVYFWLVHRRIARLKARKAF